MENLLKLLKRSEGLTAILQREGIQRRIAKSFVQKTIDRETTSLAASLVKQDKRMRGLHGKSPRHIKFGSIKPLAHQAGFVRLLRRAQPGITYYRDKVKEPRRTPRPVWSRMDPGLYKSQPSDHDGNDAANQSGRAP